MTRWKKTSSWERYGKLNYFLFNLKKNPTWPDSLSGELSGGNLISGIFSDLIRFKSDRDLTIFFDFLKNLKKNQKKMEPHNNYSGSQRKLDPVAGKMIYFLKNDLWTIFHANEFSELNLFYLKNHFPTTHQTIVTWLILPVVICLSQRLSHACLSINCLYCETANGSLNQL